MLARKDDWSFRLEQFGIEWRAGLETARPSWPHRSDTFGVRRETPCNCDRLAQKMRSPRMQGLDRLPADANALLMR